MTDGQQKKSVKSSNTMNPIVAGVAGAIVGGVAVAATVVMSSKKNQEKVKGVIVDAKDKISGYIDSVVSQPIVEKSSQKIHDAVIDIKKKIEDKL